MKALLEAWHLIGKVQEAANGLEAVRLAEEFQPNIILMDVRMPTLNGLEATKIIKTKWPHIKIIALSMYPKFREEALLAGADSFVCKGDLPEKLRDTLTVITGKDT